VGLGWSCLFVQVDFSVYTVAARCRWH